MCSDPTTIMTYSRCYPRSQNRRRRRQDTINTTTYNLLAVIIIIILCYQYGLIYHNIPYTVHSFQYDERYSIISSLHKSISRIRGGDDDRIDISRISQSIIDTSNPLATDIDRIDIGNRKPSRGLWKRIRSIRGGVDNDDDKSQDNTTIVENSQEVESLESTSLKSKEDNVDTSVDANISANDSKEEHAGKPTKEKKKKKKTSSPQAAKKEGGVFTSFISLFRADPSKKSESNIKERPVVTDTSGIAHKIPHGPDGRGGGYATMTRPKQSSSAEDDREMETEEDEFIITTDISTTDATHDKSTKPPSVGTGGNSAAFVVPPSPKPPTQTTTVDKSKDDKKSKASKSEPVVVEEEEVDISSNSTLNETESTVDYVSDTNTTGLDSSPNTTATVTDEISEDTTTLQTTDYTSSGYVSSFYYITMVNCA